jgi:hypothetical protein
MGDGGLIAEAVTGAKLFCLLGLRILWIASPAKRLLVPASIRRIPDNG